MNYMMTLEGVNPQMIANNVKPFQPTHPGEVLKDELDYLTFHAQFLTSSVRANLADPDSPVQEVLLTDFLQKCPDFLDNPYVKQIPPKYRLLTFLLLHRRRRAVNLVMRLNKRLKHQA